MATDCATAVVVVARRLDDWADPEAAFAHLFADEADAFWLDSADVQGGRARFSFMGAPTGPLGETVSARVGGSVIVRRGDEKERLDGSVFDYLRNRIRQLDADDSGLPFDFVGGFVGWLGYELKGDCGHPVEHRSPVDDAHFVLADRVLAFDHQERCVHLVALAESAAEDHAREWLDATEAELERIGAEPLPEPARPDTDPGPITFTMSRPYATYLRDIAQIKRWLGDGETYEVCLTNMINADIAPDPLTLYRTLRAENPAPHAAYLRSGGVAVLSSSPERFLKVDRQRIVEAKPIKGTRARCASPEDDAQAADSLRSDPKSRAENLMIVDLLRNDLARVCDIGTVTVPDLMAVESYATVHQLVTTVQGRLRDDVTAVECVRSAFPGGSMTGAPKHRTLQLLDQVEREARGVYSGAIGFFSANGTADLSIVIRTIVRTPVGCTIGSGGAIVMDSDPEEEFSEMMLKAKAQVRAIVHASGGSGDLARYGILGERRSTWRTI